jgi:ABC-2 type transport system permease protein
MSEPTMTQPPMTQPPMTQPPMTQATVALPFDPASRTAPSWGALNRTLLGVELRRVLRNRRTIIFAFVFPTALFFAFAGSQDYAAQRVGVGNVSAYIMVSMALYGAALTAASGGTAVALERSLGWSRQLRLTPLSPVSYILVKTVLAVLLGAIAVTVVNLAGAVQGKPDMPLSAWLACAALTVVCSLVFAALGVFVGYLVPGENAMQILGPGLALLSFLGNVFIPITHGTTMWWIASTTPMFGVAEISRWPLTRELDWYAVVNAVVWLAIFVAGAAWRMSRDTARV